RLALEPACEEQPAEQPEERPDREGQPALEKRKETEEAREEAQDIFGSLLGGPGVIPVGSPTPPLADGAEAHVLSDTRPTVLNDDEPLWGPQGRQDDISVVLGGPGQEKS